MHRGITLGELKWLARQARPVWGGHIERGEPTPVEMQAELDRGIIRRVGNGYLIGSEGRKILARNVCPTCGQICGTKAT